MKTQHIFTVLTLAAIFTSCSSPFAPDEASERRAEAEKNVQRVMESRRKAEELKKKKAFDYNPVEVNELYSLDVPDYMKSTGFLNDEASLQYFDVYKNEYVIVIDEDKAEFIEVFKEMYEYDESKSVIENYAAAQVEFFSQDLYFKKETGLRPIKINGKNGLRKSVVADVDGVPDPISYQFAFAEGEETLYMIMAWTIEENESDFYDTQLHMFRSLVEL